MTRAEQFLAKAEESDHNIRDYSHKSIIEAGFKHEGNDKSGTRKYSHPKFPKTHYITVNPASSKKGILLHNEHGVEGTYPNPKSVLHTMKNHMS